MYALFLIDTGVRLALSKYHFFPGSISVHIKECSHPSFNSKKHHHRGEWIIKERCIEEYDIAVKLIRTTYMLNKCNISL